MTPALAVELFATPVIVFDLPGRGDADRVLAARILDEERATPGIVRSNVGGWHSAPDLARRDDAELRALLQTIVEHVRLNVRALVGESGREPPHYRYGLTAWSMVLRDGEYVTPHDHGDAHWSIAYYVDAGDAAPAPSGHLAFLDPRRSARMVPGIELFPSTFTVAPRTGSLVIFPGWLQHYVHAYRGTRPRICISANVAMDLAPAPAWDPL